MADIGQLSGSGVQVLGASAVDQARLAGSGIQTLSTGDIDRALLAGSGIQTLSAGPVDRARLAGASIQVLLVGPLTALSTDTLIPVQGELAQGGPSSDVQRGIVPFPVQGARIT